MCICSTDPAFFLSFLFPREKNSGGRHDTSGRVYHCQDQIKSNQIILFNLVLINWYRPFNVISKILGMGSKVGSLMVVIIGFFCVFWGEGYLESHA